MTNEIYIKIQNEKKVKEDRGDRQNSGLQDLIRILLLRELLQKPRPPIRPPMPPGPPNRPPYGPSLRPPMRPR